MKFELVSKKEQINTLSKTNSTFMPNLLINETLSFINNYDNNPVEETENKPKFHLPKRSTKHSAGYDFILPMDICIPKDSTVIIPTFVKVELKKNLILAIYPRSSYGMKKNLMIANTVGIIDSDYYNNESNEGHIFIAYRNMGNEEILLKQGDKFAQGIIQPFYLVDGDNFDSGEKRKGGIGSSGK